MLILVKIYSMFYLVLFTFLAFLFITPFVNGADISVSVSKSILVGVLYDKYYVEDEEVYDNTLQFSFIFILITFKWDTE